jgi:hypothetical protein
MLTSIVYSSLLPGLASNLLITFTDYIIYTCSMMNFFLLFIFDRNFYYFIINRNWFFSKG